MPTTTLASEIRRYALAGAQARLAEISSELEAIRRAFPELRENGSRGARTRQSAVTGGDEPIIRTRRRRSTMTAAQRKAVGERMTKYWAARRAGTATAAAPAVEANEPTTAKRTRAGKGAKRGAAKRGPRNMSPEARKRISDAQKARWAKQRGEAKATETPSASESSPATQGRRAAKRGGQSAAKRGSRKVSAAARKRMSAAQKKRWAAKRASR